MNNYKDNMQIAEFEKFYKEKELGDLTFPNGTLPSLLDSITGHYEVPYFIKLEELYEAINGMRGFNIPSLKLLGVVAYGDAVRYPGYELEPHTYRKWLIGPKVTEDVKVPIQTYKADFLVVTEKNPIPIPSISNSQAARLCNRHVNDIYLDIRGIDQVIKGLEMGLGTPSNTDYESIASFTNGVPVFFNDNDLERIMVQSGATNTNPRHTKWNYYKKRLYGLIG
jgi:hypothetical protein